MSIVVALAASLFLLFLVAPLVGLVGGGGVAGLRQLVSDDELQFSPDILAITSRPVCEGTTIES